MLLAVDLGLRTAWALYDSEGLLQRFESRRFQNRSQLKCGVPAVLRTLPDVDVIVAEGDAKLAKVWFACREGWETELIHAERWRRDLFDPRDHRSGSEAKASAIRFAEKIICADQAGFAKRLNDDTAEAVLVGYWAVLNRGWRHPNPP